MDEQYSSLLEEQMDDPFRPLPALHTNGSGLKACVQSEICLSDVFFLLALLIKHPYSSNTLYLRPAFLMSATYCQWYATSFRSEHLML